MTIDRIRELKTPRQFAGWLSSLPADRRFRPGHMCECPIGQYLTAIVGSPAFVDHKSFDFQGEIGEYETPAWAAMFILAIDYRTRQLAPAAALAVLRRVCPEVQQ